MRPQPVFIRIPYYFAWGTSLVATLGSLYLSDIMQLTPCTLCWYQRILMYPLVIILGIGITLKDARLYVYSLPFAVIGWLIAFYHSFLQWGMINTSGVCTTAVSCTDKVINLLGFITIPFMSLVAFTLILFALLVAYRRSTKQ